MLVRSVDLRTRAVVALAGALDHVCRTPLTSLLLVAHSTPQHHGPHANTTMHHPTRRRRAPHAALAFAGDARFDFATRGSSGSYEPGPGVSCGKNGRAFWLLVVPKAGRSLLERETLFCAST